MLSLKDYKEIEKDISKIYSQLELKIIENIALRLTKINFAKGVVLNNVKVLQQMGLLYNDIIELVGKYSHLSSAEVKRLFEQAGAKTIAYDDKIYKKNGIKVNPFNQSPALVKFLDTMITRTNKDLRNLTLTTANNAQELFINAVNNSYLEVSTGYKSYSQSILDAVKQLSEQGAYVTYSKNGKTRKDKIEVATRRAVMTSISQTCGELQLKRAIELGWDLMQLTAHKDPRPTHAVWQGKKVSLSGQKGYLSLKDIKYGKIDGFKGINCYHDWLPTTKNSKLLYTNQQLSDMLTKVDYNGKEITGYEAKQIRRRKERQIREDKRELSGIQGILKNNNLSKQEIIDFKTAYGKKSLIYNTHKNELNNFIKQTEGNNDYLRLNTGKIERNVMNEKDKVVKIADKYNTSIIGMKVNNIEIKSVGEHIISRTYAIDIDYNNILDTLNNPIKFGKIRKDGSQQIKGKECVIVINVDTGKLITSFAKKTKSEV